MTMADELITAAEQLREEALSCADRLDKTVMTCNKAKMVSSVVGFCGSVVAVVAGTAVTVMSAGAAAPFLSAGAFLAASGAVCSAGSDLAKSASEKLKLETFQQQWEDFIRKCRRALEERNIDYHKIEADLTEQAGASQLEVDLCIVKFMVYLGLANLGCFGVIGCRREAAILDPDKLVAFNWAKLLESVRRHPLLLANVGFTGLNLRDLVISSIAVYSGKRSKVGNFLRDLASFLDDIAGDKCIFNC